MNYIVVNSRWFISYQKPGWWSCGANNVLIMNGLPLPGCFFSCTELLASSKWAWVEAPEPCLSPRRHHEKNQGNPFSSGARWAKKTPPCPLPPTARAGPCCTPTWTFLDPLYPRSGAWCVFLARSPPSGRKNLPPRWGLKPEQSGPRWSGGSGRTCPPWNRRWQWAGTGTAKWPPCPWPGRTLRPGPGEAEEGAPPRP